MRGLDVLAADARRSIWLTRVRRLIEYVGDSLPLTDKGNLKVTDGKALVPLLETRDHVDYAIGERVWRTRSVKALREVDLTFHVALTIDALSIKGKRLVRGRNDVCRQDDLVAWQNVFVALAEKTGIVALRYAGDTYGWGWFAEDLDEMMPSLLVDLFDTPLRLPMERVLMAVWDELMECYDFSDVPKDKLDFHRGLVGGALHYAMQTLAEHGVIDMDDAAWLHTARSRADAEGTIALTELGRWAVGPQIALASD